MSAAARSLLTSWEATWRAHPDKPAVLGGNGAPTTFSALHDRARALAEQLPPTESSPQLIAVHLPNGSEWMAHYLAVLFRRQVFLPIDPQLPPATANDLAARLGAACLVSRSGIQVLQAESAAAPLPSGAHLVKLTSASTGQPKALFFGEAEMLADAGQIIAGMGLRADDRHLVAIPLGHSYALGNLVLPCLLQGSTLVCADEVWPQTLFRTISRGKVSVLPLVPPLVRGLSALPEGDGLPDSVRLVISAGGSLSPEAAVAFRQRHGRPVHNFYGASETGGIAFDPTGEATATGRSAGRPLPGVALEVEADGRVRVSSAAVYRERSGGARGAASFTLADLGELTPAGELVLRGRSDDVVKIGGRRIALSEIEATLRHLPGVEDAAVAAREDERGEPRLAALIATHRPAEELRALARQRLPAWKCPRIWQTCTELPYTPRGKLDRTAVLRRLQ